jgi:hypothetical protein
MPMARDDPQLNLRLSAEQFAVLEAAAFVQRTTPSQLARDVLDAAVAAHARSPTVRKALDARAEQDAVRSGTLAHLSGARATRRRRSAGRRGVRRDGG